MPPPKWEMSATLAYPAVRVWPVLSDFTPGQHKIDDVGVLATAGIFEPHAPVSITENNGRFTVDCDDHTSAVVAVDDSTLTGSVEGQWWYWGTFSVADDGDHSCVLTHRVYDIASGAGALPNHQD